VTYEEERELAERQFSMQQRCAAKAVGLRKAQHLESMRYLAEKYGFTLPASPPPLEVLKDEYRKLGFIDAFHDFEMLGRYQLFSEPERLAYLSAWRNLRKLAKAAFVGHPNHGPIWIPCPAKPGEVYEFMQITPGTPKGSRDFFNTEVYSK
jgi:hypothetical protein